MVVSKIFGIFTPKIGEDFHLAIHIFQMGWFNSTTNMPRYCLETAQLLLDAKSDINLQYEAKGVFKTIEMINRTRLRLFGSDSALVQFFAKWTTTPLGFACFYGCDEFVEFLLRHDADPNKTNARGKRPFQLAKGQSVLKIIEDFKSIQSI